jgi:hypothetical protein
MKIVIIFFLFINLYGENNFKLLYNDIEELYSECIEETEKKDECQKIMISNYILFYNFMNFKLDRNSTLDVVESNSLNEHKEYIKSKLDELFVLHSKKREKIIKNDINYSKKYYEKYMGDYDAKYEKCEVSGSSVCVANIEKKELEDLEKYRKKILAQLSKNNKKYFDFEHKEWAEYQNIYAEILKNNYNSDISSNVYEGSMWNSVEAGWYSQSITKRRAKLKSYINKN